MLCVACVKHESICRKNYRKFCQRCETSHMICKPICVKICITFFSLTIRSCRDNSSLRRIRFVKTRKLYWSMSTRSTNEVILSILFLVFAFFVVAMSFEKITSFSWQTSSTFVKRHVLSCSIYEQKKSKNLLRIQICFRNCHAFFMINLLNEIFYLFFVVWRKKKNSFHSVK